MDPCRALPLRPPVAESRRASRACRGAGARVRRAGVLRCGRASGLRHPVPQAMSRSEKNRERTQAPEKRERRALVRVHRTAPQWCRAEWSAVLRFRRPCQALKKAIHCEVDALTSMSALFVASVTAALAES